MNETSECLVEEIGMQKFKSCVILVATKVEEEKKLILGQRSENNSERQGC